LKSLSVASVVDFRFGGNMKKIRILMAKAGLDGHDRGIKVVARALRDAGFEVIYTGLHQTPEMIATSAVQEDVDLIGISVLSGAHMTIFPKVMNLLKEKGRGDMVVFGGGIIPLEDMEELEQIGISKLFGPGTPTPDIIGWTKEKFGIDD
jgi:methylmalonyl-CoA mutase C-terminal domain/subunit